MVGKGRQTSVCAFPGTEPVCLPRSSGQRNGDGALYKEKALAEPADEAVGPESSIF